MILVILAIIVYFSIVPVTLFGLRQFKLSVMQRIYGRRRKNVVSEAYRQETKWSIIRKHISFTLREDRRKVTLKNQTKKKPAVVLDWMSNKLMFIAIIIVGLSMVILSALVGNLLMFIIGIVVELFAYSFSIKSSSDILDKRDQILSNMVIKKKAKMGLMTEGKNTVNPSNEFRIKNWGADYVSPLEVSIFMPPTFEHLAKEPFMRSWNETMSTNGVWVADMNDEEYPGFDFKAGVASIRVVKPLPGRADWDSKYLLSDDIAWSFFPMAIGSENGVPITTKGDGGEDETVHILGFSLNNEQQKLSKKRGHQMGPDLVAAPQVLIAGGTGGGKALASNTKVEVIRK